MAADPARPPRVMYVITRLSVSGPSPHVMLANRGLAKRGWDTLLVHGTPEPDEQEVALDDFDLPRARVTTLRRPIAPRDAAALVSLIRLMRRFRPSVVHTHHSKAGLLGRLAAAATRVPVRVHTFHGNVFEGYFSPRVSAVVLRTERAMARLTTRLVVLTEAQREELVRLRVADAGRFVTIPLGAELDRFGVTDRAEARRRLGLPEDWIVILAVGRLAPIKRYDRLLRAFAGVAGELPAAHLVVLGDGAVRAELEAQVDQLGLRQAVTFAGWAEDVATWYAACDLVANSSDNEGMPVALIEAAAGGRPVVATDVGGVAAVVEDGVSGFLVPREDETLLADRIRHLAADAETRAAMGRAARERSARFGVDHLVDRLDGLYRELLAGPR